MPDWTTILASVLASTVLSSVISGIIAPSVNWGLEKKKLLRADRKEKIQRWRQMVHEINLEVQAIEQGKTPRIPKVQSQAGFLIEQHPDFLSLQPHLQRGGVFQSMTVYAGRTMPSELIHLAAEIDRIEKEWDLT
jgi:hypothetical protein